MTKLMLCKPLFFMSDLKVFLKLYWSMKMKHLKGKVGVVHVTDIPTQLESCLYDQLDAASLLLVSLLFIAIPTLFFNF